MKKITPQQALLLLKEGNTRFLKDKKKERSLMEEVKETADGQSPFATILTCMDSRVVPEYLFDQGIGDLFTLCTPGATVSEDTIKGLELSTKFFGAKLIVVMAHTSCGVIHHACQASNLGSTGTILEKITPAIQVCQSEDEKLVTDAHIMLTVNKILEQSPIIKELSDQGTIQVIGALYDVKTGIVHFKNGS